jgi:hypothetical protein
VQLLDGWVLNVVLTTLIVTVGISFVLSAAAAWIRPARGAFPILFLAAFAFSLLGFVTGQLLGDSREAAVAAVVPAVLTLLGGVAAFVVGTRGVRSQSAISAILVCFTLSLLVGSLFGIRLRVEYEFALQDPILLGQRDVALQRNQLAVDIQRLQDYAILLKLRDDLAKSENIDLTRFESALEKRPSKKKEDQAEIGTATLNSAKPHAEGPDKGKPE